MLLAESTRLLSLLNFLPPFREKVEKSKNREAFTMERISVFIISYFSIKELIGK